MDSGDGSRSILLKKQDLTEKIIFAYQNFSMPRKINGISDEGTFLFNEMEVGSQLLVNKPGSFSRGI